MKKRNWEHQTSKTLWYVILMAFVFAGLMIPASAQSPGELVQSAGFDNAHEASVTFSSQPTEGNLLVAFSAHRRTWTRPNISGTGWTLVGDAPINQTGTWMAVWYKTAGPSEPTTIESFWDEPFDRPDRRVSFTVNEYAGGGALGEMILVGEARNSANGATSLSAGPTAASTSDNTLVLGLVTTRGPGQGDAAENVEVVNWPGSIETEFYALGISDTWPVELHIARLAGAAAGPYQVQVSWDQAEVISMFQLLVFEPAGSEDPDPEPSEFLVDPTDLVVYYSFDEFGGVVPDLSGNDIDGTVNGTITPSAEGRFGSGAAQFTSGSFLDLDGPNVPADLIPTSAFTLAAWLKLDDTGGQHALFNAFTSEDVYLIHPEVRPDDYRFMLRGNRSEGNNVTIGNLIAGTPTFGEWIHWAGTYDKDAQSMILYINGQVVGSFDSNTLTNAVDIADDWDKGARVGINVDNARPLVGLMDEFYIFKRALSAQEIQLLVDGPQEEPTGLVWDFCDGLQGWVNANQSPVSWDGSRMVVNQAATAPETYDPHIAIAGLSHDLEANPELAIKLTVENAPRAFAIGVFSFRQDAGHIRPLFSGVGNGEHILRLNYLDEFPTEEAWTLTQLRLDIPENEPHQNGGAWPDFKDMVVTIDWVALTNDPNFVPEPCPVVVNISGPDMVVQGSDVILWADVSGAMGNVSYQWWKDGQELPGETNSFLELTAVTMQQSGQYAVAVTDDNDTVTQTHILSVVEAMPLTGHAGLLMLVLAASLSGFVLLRQRHVSVK